MAILWNKAVLGGKEFNFNDSVGGRKSVTSYNVGHNFYGGSVDNFYPTKEGFLMCVQNHTNKVVGLYIPFLDSVTSEGLQLLEAEGLIPKTNTDSVTVTNTEENTSTPIVEVNIQAEKSLDNMTRYELLAMAKQVGVKGKTVTMGFEALKKAIREATNNEE